MPPPICAAVSDWSQAMMCRPASALQPYRLLNQSQEMDAQTISCVNSHCQIVGGPADVDAQDSITYASTSPSAYASRSSSDSVAHHSRSLPDSSLISTSNSSSASDKQSAEAWNSLIRKVQRLHDARGGSVSVVSVGLDSVQAHSHKSSGEVSDCDDRQSGSQGQGEEKEEEDEKKGDLADGGLSKKRPFVAEADDDDDSKEDLVAGGHSLLSLGPPSASLARKASKIPRLPGKPVNIFVDLNLSSQHVVPINNHIEVCKRVASGISWKQQIESAFAARVGGSDAECGWSDSDSDSKPLHARLALSLAWQQEGGGGGEEKTVLPHLSSSKEEVNGNGKVAGMEAQGLSLVHLLLQCAQAAAREDAGAAAKILAQLYQGASLYGDSMQRVAAYFAEGLAARVVGKCSPLYATLMQQPSVAESLFAFTALYKVSPYFQFAYFTANQVILEAMEGQQLVHIVDLNIMQGFQWPSLIQSLASRPEGPPHLLRITGVGEEAILRGTAHRLASFATSFNIALEFNAVARAVEELTVECVCPRPGEAIALNSVFQLHTLLHQQQQQVQEESKLHKFLRSMSRLAPKVVTLVEQEANHNAPTFLLRFMEALHYYAAVFDSLDASLPQLSEDRVKIEQLHFATQIKNIVACEGAERVERHQTSELWQQRMTAAGFSQLPLSFHNVTQAKLLLQLCPCEGYKLSERGGWVSLGWQGRQLLTASAWALQ